MQAAIGDRIVVRSHHVGEHDREAIILDVGGNDGSPPYKVRWTTTGIKGCSSQGRMPTCEHLPV